jgi:hypothetical protein
MLTRVVPDAALQRLTVVIPVGPGDGVPPRLIAQLAPLPSAAQVRVVGAENCAAENSVAVNGAAANPAPGSQVSRDAASASPCAEAAMVPLDDAGADAGAAGGGSAGAGPDWRWLHAPAGRATQQNAGAAAGDRDWVWFVHADTRLASDTLPALARFIARDRPALGYFDLHFDGDRPVLMRLNTAGAWLRSRWLRLPFGDQGFVLPRTVFDALGGFNPAITRGEDHELVWRVRRAGLQVRPVGAALYTSARRYAAQGWATTTTGHLAETWRQAWRFSRARTSP